MAANILSCYPINERSHMAKAIKMTTALPNLSDPTLLTPEILKQNPRLASSIFALCNAAFSGHQATDPRKWDTSTPRFSTLESFYKMLTPESIVGVVFALEPCASTGVGADSNSGINKAANANGHARTTGEEDENDSLYRNKVIACSAAVPWKGGWHHECPHESGWEMKIVCVDDDPLFRHRGIAVAVQQALESRLASRERDRGQVSLKLWVLANESINGAYWRKRGYHKVRGRIEGPGVWGCREGMFEMNVYAKTLGIKE